MSREAIYYVTENSDKMKAAREFLAPFNIQLRQASLGIPEIQSDSVKEIAIHKAQQAYAVVQRPLFVSDSGWSIAALKGFPGPYMRHINSWFSAQDFLKLMEGHKNREVILEEVIVYADAKRSKVFTHKTLGTVLEQPTGSEIYQPSDRIFSISDSGFSIAQEKELNQYTTPSESLVWEEFGAWLNTSKF